MAKDRILDGWSRGPESLAGSLSYIPPRGVALGPRMGRESAFFRVFTQRSKGASSNATA
jgi:hypothetical protein